MGEYAGQPQQQVAALLTGLEMSLTLTYSAEMYADGGAEQVVGNALNVRHDRACRVSKFYPGHA
ncbi:aldo/keto reductase [Erwinia pyrifoliae]|uniref:aldo/keto reductase n=1 Tax=Erwinia pyrifoliae TaxID=79967 RepID=UPI002206C4FE|nr:aldo/keto reductase [Erwinia pyrifoliae]